MPTLYDLLYPAPIDLPEPLLPPEATALGFVALTEPYILISERTMLERAIVQLESIPWVLVVAGVGKVELWRRGVGSVGLVGWVEKRADGSLGAVALLE